MLKRAIKTLFLIQEELDLHWIPVTKSWRLNERMYGGLQGLNKSETAAKHGEDQVKVLAFIVFSFYYLNQNFFFIYYIRYGVELMIFHHHQWI